MVVFAWLAWLVATYFISQYLTVEIFTLLPENIFGSGDIKYLVMHSLYYGFMLLIGLGVPYLLRYELKLPSLKNILGFERKVEWSDFGRALLYVFMYYAVFIGLLISVILLFILVYYSAALIGVDLPLNFPLVLDLMGQEQDLGFSIPGSSPLTLVVIFIILVILTPITEELLMRGLFFNRLRARFSFFWASFLVSLVFAVAHWQINVGIDTFILSMVMCYAREKTGAIYANIFMHAIKNGIAFSLLLFT